MGRMDANLDFFFTGSEITLRFASYVEKNEEIVHILPETFDRKLRFSNFFRPYLGEIDVS